MSTDNLATIASILPNRGTPAVRNPVQESTGSPVPAAGVERQDIAVSGKNVPVSQAEEPREAEERPEQLESVVSEINSYVQNVNRKIQFSVDEALPLGRSVIKVIDSETDKVIREFPSEEALQMARRINEQLEENFGVEGLIFSDRA